MLLWVGKERFCFGGCQWEEVEVRGWRVAKRQDGRGLAIGPDKEREGAEGTKI